jgi:hypothetical protein
MDPTRTIGGVSEGSTEEGEDDQRVITETIVFLLRSMKGADGRQYHSLFVEGVDDRLPSVVAGRS